MKTLIICVLSFLYRKGELEDLNDLKAKLTAANSKIIETEVSCVVDNFKGF